MKGRSAIVSLIANASSQEFLHQNHAVNHKLAIAVQPRTSNAYFLRYSSLPNSVT